MPIYELWAILKSGRRWVICRTINHDYIHETYRRCLRGIPHWNQEPLSGERVAAYSITTKGVDGVRPNTIPGRKGKYRPDTKLV